MGETRTRTPFPLIEHHVLLARSGEVQAADAQLALRLTEEFLGDLLEAIPDDLRRRFTAGPVALARASERFL